MNYIKIALLIAIAFTISISCSIYAEFIEPIDMAFTYTVDLASLGIAPRYVAAIDVDRILIAGTINGVNGVAIANVDDPYRGVKVEQIYPLTGAPTYVGVNGFPVDRIAVGSDRGEVLVFNVLGGRITGYLYTVLGSDFYVNKIYVSRGETSYKVIALVSEGGPKTTPCTRCYVYVFDEGYPGVMRIGPKTGNATVSIERVYIQDVAPVTIYDTSKIYSNASLVALTYIPADLIALEFTIYYLYNNTLYPAANTLVEVLAYDKARGISYLYGVNADGRGNVSIPLIAGLYANLSIRDITGKIVWNMTFDPRKYIAIDNVVALPLVIITTPPDTRSAMRVYGTPEFLKVAIEVVDLSKAVSRYTVVASANFRLDVDVEGFSFIYSAREPRYTIVFGSPSKGYTNLVRVGIAGKTLNRVFQTIDYVGINTKPVNIITFADGSYVNVALSDGRIRVYRVDKSNYTLHHIYPMDSPIRRIISIPTIEGYTYSVITDKGIQILKASPLHIPIIRNTTTLYGTIPNYVDSDVLPDLSTIYLASSNTLTVIRNFDRVAMIGKIVALEEIRAPSLTIKITMPGNESYDKVVAEFYYPNNKIVLKPDENGVIKIDNVVPGTSYRVSISYQEPYIIPENMTVVLDSFRDRFIEVRMRYREFMVKLKVLDTLSVVPIAPYDIYADGVKLAEGLRMQETTLRLIYGVHTIAIAPTQGFENVYNATYIRDIYIDGDKELQIQLYRKLYRLKLYVFDRLTNTSPIAPMQIRIQDIFDKIYTLPLGVDLLEAVIPYGNVTINIEPVRGWEKVYKSKSIVVGVSEDSMYRVYIDRIEYSVKLNISDRYTYSLITPIEIYVNNSIIYRGSESSIYFKIGYGVWNITIAPSKGFEAVYSSYSTLVTIDNDVEFSYIFNRTLYDIAFEIKDRYGTLLSPINISVKGVISINQLIEPPRTRAYFQLPYGEYIVYIEPVKGFETIYIPINISFTANAPQLKTINIDRVRYRIDIAIRDIPIGRLVGIFDLYANGSKIQSNIRGSTSVEIPCGIYNLQLIPQPPWDAFYEASKPISTPIFNNTSLTINVNRKLFNLKITAIEGTVPIRNAVVAIESLETGITITQLITDESGSISTKIPYGTYRIVIAHPDYYPYEIPLNVNSDIYEIAYLRPIVTTLILRYLPIILTLAGIIAAIYIVLKIRAIIARRLAPEEELF